MGVLSLLRGVSPAGLYPPLCPSSGLAGHRTDLSVIGLRAAYAKGLDPIWERGQQTWLAPGTRMVLFIENFHIEPAVRRRLARKDFRVTFDQDFAAVVRACAAAGAGRMSPDMIAAFVVGPSRRACPLRRDLGPLRRSCRRHFRSRHRQGLLHRGLLRQGERRLQGRVRCAQLPFAALGLSDE